MIKRIINKLIKKKIEINIFFKKEKNIKNINKKFRNKNKATDILTFKSKSKKKFAIDIILYKNLIKKRKLKKIILHGILHALNYSHENIKNNKIMENIGDKIGMSGIEPPTTTTSK